MLQMRRKDSNLLKQRSLVPPNMLMVEAVATDVDDSDKRYVDFDVRGRDTGEQPRYDGGMRAGEDELVCSCISIGMLNIGFCTCRLLYPAQRCGRLY